MAPGDGPSLRVKTGGEAVVKVGSIHVVLNVFFASPDDLHGTLDLLCDRHRLRDEVDFESPTEAAAEKMVVNDDFLRRKSRYFGGHRLGAGNRLGSHPDFAAVLLDVNRAVDRLHRGVSKKRNLVDGIEPGF